jgi:hypothetical protein
MVAKFYVNGVDVSSSVDWSHFSICTMGGKNYKPTSIQYNNPYTICYFEDGTKVVSKCTEGEKFNPEYGVMSCITKYLYGTRSQFMKTIKKGYDQEVARKIKQTKIEKKKSKK